MNHARFSYKERCFKVTDAIQVCDPEICAPYHCIQCVLSEPHAATLFFGL